MNRKLIAALVLFFVAALGAFAQEDEGVSVDAWVGVSAGDVLSEAAFVTKYGVVLGNLFGTGLEAGIDELVWAVTPESSVGMDAYAEYGFGSADSPFAFGVGASTTLVFGDELLADAGLYLASEATRNAYGAKRRCSRQHVTANGRLFTRLGP